MKHQKRIKNDSRDCRSFLLLHQCRIPSEHSRSSKQDGEPFSITKRFSKLINFSELFKVSVGELNSTEIAEPLLNFVQLKSFESDQNPNTSASVHHTRSQSFVFTFIIGQGQKPNLRSGNLMMQMCLKFDINYKS